MAGTTLEAPRMTAPGKAPHTAPGTTQGTAAPGSAQGKSQATGPGPGAAPTGSQPEAGPAGRVLPARRARAAASAYADTGAEEAGAEFSSTSEEEHPRMGQPTGAELISQLAEALSREYGYTGSLEGWKAEARMGLNHNKPRLYIYYMHPKYKQLRSVAGVARALGLLGSPPAAETASAGGQGAGQQGSLGSGEPQKRVSPAAPAPRRSLRAPRAQSQGQSFGGPAARGTSAQVC